MSTPHRISAAAPDAAINQAVAEHVAGWKRKAAMEPLDDQPGISRIVWFDAENKWVTDDDGNWAEPRFATSADCVLPFVVSHGATVQWSYPSELPERPRHCLVGVFTTINGETNMFEADAATFPRAACLALLAAHGYEVTP